jgi:hypothetical protein
MVKSKKRFQPDFSSTGKFKMKKSSVLRLALPWFFVLVIGVLSFAPNGKYVFIVVDDLQQILDGPCISPCNLV